jgi:predicted dehydrogenase
MNHLTRRNLIKYAAAVSLPLFLPSRVFGDDAPSKKINVGFIGVGWQGGSNLDQFLAVDDCRVLAVCDVDDKHLAGGAAKVNKKYGDESCKKYRDFRDLINDPDIDAVAINTPDHWHSIPAIMAANAKKDIFCEKPLSHTLAEGIAMVEASTRNKRVWQTGSWQRSQTSFRHAAQLVQNGYIGKVFRVEVGLPGGHNDFLKLGKDTQDGLPPAGVDYEQWIGPAEMMPFNPGRFHKNWRWNSNTGGGQLMDWVGHHVDIAHWGLANPAFGCGPDDAIGPLDISATMSFPDPKATWNTATDYRIECRYPQDVEMIIGVNGKARAGQQGSAPTAAPDPEKLRNGTVWFGDKGWVYVSRGKLEASNKEWLKEIREREQKGTLEVPLYKSPGHMQEFIDCIKSRKRTLTPVEVAHRSQTPGHLALIAARLGTKLQWDTKSQTFVGSPEANAMLSKKFRAPWKL